MDRREFTKAMGAVVAGMVAGSKVFAQDKPPAAKPAEKPAAAHTADKKADLHVCKGRAKDKKNACASAEYKHDCAGKNACTNQGGCKSGDAGCAGKNGCGKKGGCAVPVKAEHLAKEKAGKSACSGKSGCK